MEGRFLYSLSSHEQVQHKERLQQITDGKKPYKVCSLSKTYKSRLLWAHYASGFDGLAVEVELPVPEPRIHNVIYQDVLPMLDLQSNVPLEEEVPFILTHKHIEWNYEEEVRIIQKTEWYELRNPVRRIIIGHRFNEALFQALRIVCERKDITLNRTRVDERMGVVDETL
jgi:hypothetical protein